MPYRRAPDIYLPEDHGDIIVLDAARNAYFCLTSTSAGKDGRFDELVAEGLMVWSESADPAPAARATRDLYRLAADCP